MTVEKLMEIALRNLNEDFDEQNIGEFGLQLIDYMNIAYMDIMKNKVHKKTSEKITVSSIEVPFYDLEYEVLYIDSVTGVDGQRLKFGTGDNKILFNEEVIGDIVVVYSCLPKRLKNMDDEPAFDPSLHYCLADYATYRMFITGGKSRQSRGEPFYGEYLRCITKFDSYVKKIINAY